MKKAISLVLSMMLLVLLASAALSESQGTDMYVYTKNGKVLKVRSSMSTKDDSNVIGTLAYGQKVVTYGGNFNGWTLIDYGDGWGDAYVMYRFLSKTKPEPYNPSANPTQEPTGDPIKAASTVIQMNDLVASARYVTPYTVVVRPTRASGWVYMRWFPSRSAKEVATFNGYHELTVIAELKDWYQVSDPDSGRIGFVYKSYVQ